MQYYEPDENKRGKLLGALWTGAFYLAVGLLMWLVNFTLSQPEPVDQGILVNFGDVAEAGGAQDTPNSDEVPVAVSLPQASSRPVEQAPSHAGDVEVPSPERQQPTQAQPTEPVRQADPRASYPGRTNGSTSASEGTSAGAGNQGNPAGSPEGSHTGTGTGTSGTAYNLTGRSPLGSLPLPAYERDRDGKVVIRITVSPDGRVTNAAHQADGSTIRDAALIEAARQAALKARFTAADIENAQVGTITYVFKMQ